MKVLAVGAHLDDIELACGGTLAKAIDKGHQVKMIVMSESGYTNYDGRIMRTAHDAICEGRNAAHVLGVGDIEILKFDSKDIPYHYDVIEILDEKIQNYSPDIIFKPLLPAPPFSRLRSLPLPCLQLVLFLHFPTACHPGRSQTQNHC